VTGQVAASADGFFFLSRVLERPVLSRDGEHVGHLLDLGCAAGEVFPRVLTMYIRPGFLAPVTLAVAAPAFECFPSPILKLAVPTSDLLASQRRLPDEILLRREILDKQIVDTDGARVVRVNDVHLLRARGSELRVVHVDIGLPGLIRRLGWEALFRRLARSSRRFESFWSDARLLSWRYVVPLRSGALPRDLRLSVTQTQLAQLHPAEIAEIMEELDRFEGPAMLDAIGVPKAAATLAEVNPELQRLILESIDIKRAGELLATMPPDEAADILEEMPEAMRARLLGALPADDAATVTDLLSHEPDSAGSVMNPELFAVVAGTSVGEIVRRLREGPQELVRAYAVVVLGDDGRMRGLVSLPELVRADPALLVDEIMDRDPVAVRPDDPMGDVAELFDRFNLLAMPVVDQDRKLEGIIAVDDLVAWLREGEEREGRLT